MDKCPKHANFFVLLNKTFLVLRALQGVADDMKADDENIASGDLTDHYLDAAIATLTAKVENGPNIATIVI